MAGITPVGQADLQVIEVHGKKLVSGLYWKPLHSVRSYMAEAKQIGKAEGMQMVTIRKGRTILQAGFAPKGRNRLKGMYSLAAALAGQLGENWIACFQLEPDRYALAAVYKSAVVPGFDLVGGRDEIEGKLREVYSLLSSNDPEEFSSSSSSARIIAPAEMDFGNESLELAELLPAKAIRREHRLRQLTLGLTPLQLAGAAAGVVALLGGLYGASWWMEQQEAAAQRAREVAAARAKLAQQSADTAGVVYPWSAVPPTGALLEACSVFLANTPLAVGGWLFDQARCAPGKAVAVYRRHEGPPVDVFVAAVHRLAGRPPGVFEQGTAGSIEAAITVAAEGNDELRNTAELLTAVTAHIQGVDDVAELSIEAKPFVPDPQQPAAVAPSWTTNSFTIQTQLPPERLFRGLDTEGMRVLEVVTVLTPDTAELNWTIKGEIYGR